MKNINNNNTYILSLEGADIYNHMVRGAKIKDDFRGMIPFSLELIKLKSVGLQFKVDKTSGKELSRDIINIKFKHKVQNAEFIMIKTLEKIDRLEIENANNDETKKVKVTKYIGKLKEFVKYLIEEIKIKDKEIVFTDIDTNAEYTKWAEMSNNVLRKYLYDNGFTITTVNDKTGEYTEDKYVVYKRSSSKSRTGQVLMIKENLCNEMINWSRMYLPFVGGMNVDYASLLAYESLVGSSLEDTIVINPKNILIINDVDSEFKTKCNVVKVNGTTNMLDSFSEDYMVKNSLFDGESLLSSELFKEGQSMMLLRNHMFKSASFNTNIQEYLIANCPENVEYQNWKIKNRFGDLMFAKDIKMICTPTSIKALKFAKDLNMTEKQIWEHWKKTVKTDKCIFGICKHEKASKRGIDDSDNILQQTSYQMINSMPFELSDLEILTTFEKEYVYKLKNDDNFFIEYIISKANDMNSNLMFAEIAKQNKDFICSAIFRDFRKGEISAHVKHCKRGKIRLNGDYCIVLGNPIEYLQHSIGKFDINKVDVEKLPLKNNEIYTKLHANNLELACFRNPHTSPSNVLVTKNKYIADIDTYFNLTKNIVCVNAILFQIQDICSSLDYDSDSIVIFNDSKMLEVAKKCFGKYDVCINDVKSNKTPYKLTTKDMCIIDNQLSTSQRSIGEVVNLGQLCMSTYWDLLSKGSKKEDLVNLIKKVDVMTVLSCICIDLAKKFYDIDIDAEIKNVAKIKELRKLKPNFWKSVSKSKTMKKKVEYYNCPMDFLNIEMSDLPNPEEQHKDIKFETLLIKHNVKTGNRHQESDVIDYVEEMCTKINSINAENSGNEDYEVEERNNLIDKNIKYYNYYIQKFTIKQNTMYSILTHVVKENNSKIQTKLLNVLFETQKETFLQAFKKKM